MMGKSQEESEKSQLMFVSICRVTEHPFVSTWCSCRFAEQLAHSIAGSSSMNAKPLMFNLKVSLLNDLMGCCDRAKYRAQLSCPG